jgi:hypothetical protein
VRANLKWKLVTQVVGSLLVLMLAIGMTSCEQSTATISDKSVDMTIDNPLATTDGPLSEVNIPESIAKLAPNLEKFQPQVKILSPRPNQVLNDDQVNIKLQVSDLPIFKSPELGLGNHLHIILDKQPYQGVYDLNQPLVFKNLAAGTHTLRVFASRPWHESFKNEGAYAQTTFHVLTKTAENNPNPQQPLLTYSRPTGIYRAEPIMLDYYLTNAPSHAIEGSPDRLPDWRIRATVNNQQFIIDRWTPVYLQGFKQGKNWVKLELVDDRGQPMPNVYNDTTSIITYDPQTRDSLAKLIRGEIDANLARTLIDPNYVAAKPIPLSTPVPVVIPTPINESIPAPTPGIVTAPPIVKPIPSPIVAAPPQPTVPSPVQVQTPTVIVQPKITPVPVPVPVPVSAPAVSKPAPISDHQPLPVTIPAPTVSKSPVISTPQPLAEPAGTRIETPSQVAPQPTNVPFEPATSIRQAPMPTPELTQPAKAVDVPSNGLPSVSSRSTPEETSGAHNPATAIEPSPSLQPQNPTSLAVPITTATPQVAEQTQQTWKTQAIELLKIAGVKTRAFTNTIPGKAQRFGHNVQIWTGKAIDTIQAWRDRR